LVVFVSSFLVRIGKQFCDPVRISLHGIHSGCERGSSLKGSSFITVLRTSPLRTDAASRLSSVRSSERQHG
jgi:hypothetical protein